MMVTIYIIKIYVLLGVLGLGLVGLGVAVVEGPDEDAGHGPDFLQLRGGIGKVPLELCEADEVVHRENFFHILVEDYLDT